MLKSFSQLKKEAMAEKNKIGFLVDVFKVLHDDAPPEDFTNLGGRMAGILNLANRDYLIVLQAIWKTSADSITGSHLNFIQGVVKNRTSNVFSPKPTNFGKVVDSWLPKRVDVKDLHEKERAERATEK